MSSRPYRMGARAKTTEDTAVRLLEAMQKRFAKQVYEEVRLEDVARDAGVTLQTLLRRFGSKEGLLAAAAAEGAARVAAERQEAPVGDTRAAVRNLFGHYEAWGAVSLRLLAQEERIPAIAKIAAQGRELHAKWVARVFEPQLHRRVGAKRQLLHHQLVAVCDVYVWKLLRIDHGQSRRQAERAVLGMVEALLDAATSSGATGE